MFSLVSMRKAGSLMSIFFLIFIMAISLTSQSVIADPVVSFEAPSEVKMDVSPGALGKTVAFINVTCNNTASQDVVVVSSVQSINCSISYFPTVLEFTQTGKGTQFIWMNISVPLESSTEIYPNITLSGVWMQDGLTGYIEPLSIPVIIKPYYRLKIQSDSYSINTHPGEPGLYDLRVDNEGNIEAVYSLNIKNRDNLKKAGIKIENYNEEIYFSEGMSKWFQLWFETSSHTPQKTYIIALEFTSVESGKTFEYYLYLWVEPGIIQIMFSPMALLLIVFVIFVAIFIYKNRGNREKPNINSLENRNVYTDEKK
jgi:hypothetical protein